MFLKLKIPDIVDVGLREINVLLFIVTNLKLDFKSVVKVCHVSIPNFGYTVD